MKKQLLLGTALSLGAAALFGANTFAADNDLNITTEADLTTCLEQTTAATCVLGDNIVITTDNPILINNDANLNLNNHNITSTTVGKFFKVDGHEFTITGTGTISANEVINTSVIAVYGSNPNATTVVNIDKNVTIKGGTAILLNQSNTNESAYNTTLNIAGTLQGTNSGLWILGNLKNQANYPTINIQDGATIISEDPNGVAEESVVGLAAMGYARYNIGKATITGEGAGLGLKSGIVNINGATITGTENITNLPPALYANGINASGAAIQIETNSGYAGNIKLSLKDVTLISKYTYALYEYGGGSDSSSVEYLNIESGTFTGTKGAISLSAYLTQSPIWKQALTSGSVITNGSVEGTTVTIAKTATVTNLPDGNTAVIDSTLPSDQTIITQETALANTVVPNFNLAARYDITIINSSGNINPNPGVNIGFNLPLPTNISPVADGFTRTFYVVRIHNGIATQLPSTTNTADGTISFESDLFSTFLIGYVDTKNTTTTSITSPNTGRATAEETSSAAASIAPLASLVLLSTTLFAGKKFLKSKKQ